jgi:hypothetical protein
MYKDANWGVVQQNGGRTCIVVLNTDDRQHAFHFLIDGENRKAQLGILQEFLPDRRYIRIASVQISVALGSGFVSKLEFRPITEGSSKYLAAILTRSDLDRMLSALEEAAGVSVTFSGGEIWQIRAPESDEATAAIDHCWKKAVNVMGEPAL